MNRNYQPRNPKTGMKADSQNTEYRKTASHEKWQVECFKALARITDHLQDHGRLTVGVNRSINFLNQVIEGSTGSVGV